MVLRPAVVVLSLCACVTAAPVRDDDAERIGASMRDAHPPAPVAAAIDPKTNDDDRIDAIVRTDAGDLPAEGLETPIPCHRCRAFGGHARSQ
ncbi:MAG: hypothetical protein QM723_36575 [Myxococcaceae bacterium]